MSNKIKSHTKVSNKPSNDKFTTTTKINFVNKNTTSNKITKINKNTLFAISNPKINTLSKGEKKKKIKAKENREWGLKK
jgi:hypothetical protein